MMDTVFCGKLADAFQALMNAAEEHIMPELWVKGRELAVHMVYNGPDCAPFTAYVRCRHDRIILASINAIGDLEINTPVRKGRMPVIVEALSTVRRHVVVESVINSHLVGWLEANGFTRDKDDDTDYSKVFDETA